MPEPCKEAKKLAEEIHRHTSSDKNKWALGYYEQYVRPPLAQKIQACIDKAKENKGG